ncbi:hypothetical protein BC834DRAFT_968039 [Gloeopeniophorella convolvens]|nr:hypothetical protein BC834DRAFT_968039 [Gloeopeniophorella convolvens]
MSPESSSAKVNIDVDLDPRCGRQAPLLLITIPPTARDIKIKVRCSGPSPPTDMPALPVYEKHHHTDVVPRPNSGTKRSASTIDKTDLEKARAKRPAHLRTYNVRPEPDPDVVPDSEEEEMKRPIRMMKMPDVPENLFYDLFESKRVLLGGEDSVTEDDSAAEEPVEERREAVADAF